ncbi:MAG: hypothetical protein HYT79_12175 [Elusimicrobia bacterium]|nr:hypothetical protein [Elusimicrobiota bacterium]
MLGFAQQAPEPVPDIKKSHEALMKTMDAAGAVMDALGIAPVKPGHDGSSFHEQEPSQEERQEELRLKLHAARVKLYGSQYIAKVEGERSATARKQASGLWYGTGAAGAIGAGLSIYSVGYAIGGLWTGAGIFLLGIGAAFGIAAIVMGVLASKKNEESRTAGDAAERASEQASLAEGEIQAIEKEIGERE